MTEIGFYHLTKTPLEVALPKLLLKAYASKERVVLRATDALRLDLLNRLLWNFEKDSFLPHGMAEDGFAEDQPVYLTIKDENPNGASILFLVDAAPFGDLEPYRRCLDLFEGGDDDAVASARERWRWCKDQGHKLVYWQQDDRGRWIKSADSTATRGDDHEKNSAA